MSKPSFGLPEARTASERMDDLEIILCDLQRELVEAWQRHFAAFPEVQVRLGDLLDVEADAYVSPANSLGIMDGGIDLALRERFQAGRIEDRVQAAILNLGMSLPVGSAIVVETGDDTVPYLVCAPTMEAPSYVGMTSNAYRAMRALLRAVTRFNQQAPGAIGIVAVPGLCTGVGGMAPEVAALQMHQAYVKWRQEPS